MTELQAEATSPVRLRFRKIDPYFNGIKSSYHKFYYYIIIKKNFKLKVVRLTLKPEGHWQDGTFRVLGKHSPPFKQSKSKLKDIMLNFGN